MKILQVVHRYWPAYGGCEQYAQVISEYLADNGHDVTVWTTDALDAAALWRRGPRRIHRLEEDRHGVRIRRFPLRYFPAHPHAMRILSALRTKRARFLYAPGTPRCPDMIRAAERSSEGFDVVHAAPFPYDSILYAGMRTARRYAVPLIVTPFVHLGEGPGSPVRRHYTRPHQLDLLRSAAAVLVHTETERDFLAGAGVPGDRLHLVGVGIHPDRLDGGDPARFRQRHRIREPIIAHIAVRCRDKGTLDLVRASEILWRSGGEFRLVLLGGSTAEFDREFAALPESARDRCLILPDAGDAEKRDLLAAMDLLALPSRTDSFGIVFLESWLYGKPVIVARAGGPQEVIERSGGGLLVPFGDREALAAAIAKFLGDARLRGTLGAAGREYTLATWTWDRLLPRIAAVYERVVEEAPRRTAER